MRDIGRHQRFGIGGRDSLDDLAFLGLARHDGSRFDGGIALVEPQVSLARGAVGPVTGKAVLGEDRPDVTNEVHWPLDLWIIPICQEGRDYEDHAS